MTILESKSFQQKYSKARKFEENGDFAKAKILYEELLFIDPKDHAGISIRLASMKCCPTPKKPSNAYIKTLFNQIADGFDYILVEQLNYKIPLKMYNNVKKFFPSKKFPNFLDLGCGTGLGAEAFEDIIEYKIGVDLSKNMLEIAKEKEDYHDLHESDVISFLEKNKNHWDLILATDLLPYIGDLEDLFFYTKKNLSLNGIFCFSIESLDEEIFKDKNIEYHVGKYQRYGHSRHYIEKLAKKYQLKLILMKKIPIRLENKEPVNGYIVILENC